MAESRRRLPIDLGALCEALEDANSEHVWYLDLDSGDLLLVAGSMEETAEVDELIDSKPERFEPVEATDSAAAYSDMRDFIATVQDRHIAELLEIASDGRGAFRRFKDVLARFLEERDRWFRFKDARVQARALEWLEELGVEPVERSD